MPARPVDNIGAGRHGTGRDGTAPAPDATSSVQARDIIQMEIGNDRGGGGGGGGGGGRGYATNASIDADSELIRDCRGGRAAIVVLSDG